MVEQRGQYEQYCSSRLTGFTPYPSEKIEGMFVPTLFRWTTTARSTRSNYGGMLIG